MIRYLLVLLVVATVAMAAGCDEKKSGAVGESTTSTTSATSAPQTTTGETETTPTAKPTHILVVKGAFEGGVGDPAGLPDDSPQKSLADIDVPADVTAQLNDQAKTVVDQVVRRNGVEPTDESTPELPTLVVSLGTAVSENPKRPMTHKGLLVEVNLKRLDGTHRAASRQIPPATNGGELTANLDHTLNTLVAMVLEKRE